MAQKKASGAKRKTGAKTRSQSRSKTASQSSAARRRAANRKQPVRKMDNDLKWEIGGWVMVLLLILITLAIYLRDSMGVFGTVINSFFVGLFGFSAYIITLYSLIMGFMWLFGAGDRTLWKKLWVGYPIMILISAMLHLINGAGLNTTSLMYKEATVRTGGLIGGFIGSGLMSLIGKTGAIIVIVFLLLIMIIVLTERSAVEGVRKAGKKTKEQGVKVKSYTEEKAKLYEERRLERKAEAALRKEMQAVYTTDENAPSMGLAKPNDAGDRQILMQETSNDGPSVNDPSDEGSSDSAIRINGVEGDVFRTNERTEESGVDRMLEAAKESSRLKERSFAAKEEIDRRQNRTDDVIDIPLLGEDPYLLKRRRYEELHGSLPETEEPLVLRGEGNKKDSPKTEVFTSKEEGYQPKAEDPLSWEGGIHSDFDRDPLMEIPIEEPVFEAEKLNAETSLKQANEASLEASFAALPTEPREEPIHDNGEISTEKVFATEEFPTGIDDQQETLEKAGASLTEAPEKKPGPSGKYEFPSIELLAKGSDEGNATSREELLLSARKLENALRNYKVEAKVIQVNKGPSVTRYELQPAQGVKVSSIVNLTDDIAMNLAASSIRVEAPIPGKSAVGIEVPNKENSVVMLRDVIDSEVFRSSKSKLTFGLGKDIDGEVRVTDIAKMPHLLIAGATGSGKSVCINSIIISLIYKSDPNDVKLILIDPKIVELSIYNGIPHLLLPVVNDVRQAAGTLNWAVQEMTRRYKKFAEMNVRDLKGYNEAVAENEELGQKMPQIVIIIDELADLMMVAAKEVETSICRLAQLARAAGMHLVIATQRPSVDVITGLIKANIPSRIAFAVASGVDSKTILDTVGAEKLLGRGDMLFWPMTSSKAVRIQGAFVTDKEVENVVEFVKKLGVTYDTGIMDNLKQGSKDTGGIDDEIDEYLNQAADLVVEKQRASISFLQRAFRIGFNRAARLMDALEANGVVGADEGGGKPRKVLLSKEEWESMK